MFVKDIDLNTAADVRIFDVYIGLAAAGYDLASPSRAGTICEGLMTQNWSQELLQYFRFARIHDGRINPYWPRASILTSVSLLIDQSPIASHTALIRAHLTAMSNLSPTDLDETIIRWAADLPKQIEVIRTARTYTNTWEYYQQAIQCDIRENGVHYQQEIISTQKRLCELLSPHFSSPPKVITILNPLQADPLTDVVSAHGRIYVVTSHLRSESCIHELIHILLDPWMRKWEKRISKSVALLDLVYKRMAHLAYAWDYSAASWANVFSETLVRVLTVIVSNYGRPEQVCQIGDLVQEGFAYALPIAETIAGIGKEQSLSDEWLEQCLWACSKFAQQTTGN